MTRSGHRQRTDSDSPKTAECLRYFDDQQSREPCQISVLPDATSMAKKVPVRRKTGYAIQRAQKLIEDFNCRPVGNLAEAKANIDNMIA